MLVGRETVLGGLGVVSGSHWFVKWGSRIGTHGAVGPQGGAGYYSSDAKGIGGDSGPAFDKILIANRYSKRINAREIVLISSSFTSMTDWLFCGAFNAAGERLPAG